MVQVSMRVSSTAKFVQAVCGLRDAWIDGPNYFDPWFRGQRRATQELVPNIFRSGLLDHEDEIRAEFARRAPQYMTEAVPLDYWGWYFLMQHYGAPTRLLDWTDSALVALFFALNGDSKCPDDDEDAAVWMLDPWWLNREVLHEDSIMLPDFGQIATYLRKPYLNLGDHKQTQVTPEWPAAIDPPFIARRIAAQRSHFTIFGWSRTGLTDVATRSGARVVKIEIARQAAARMRADLMMLGVTDSTIYPDLRGLADELTRYQLGKWPPD